MSFSESVMEIQQNGTIQLRVTLNTPISCFLWIIYVQLSIGSFQSIRWYKSSHEMVECTMNTKGCRSRTLNGIIVHGRPHRGERKSIVVLAYFLFKLSMIMRIIKQLLQDIWPLLYPRQIDLSLKTVHSKGLRRLELNERWRWRAQAMHLLNMEMFNMMTWNAWILMYRHWRMILQITLVLYQE